MNIHVPQKAKHLLTDSVTISFSWRTLLHGVSKFTDLLAETRTADIPNVKHKWYRCIATMGSKNLINLCYVLHSYAEKDYKCFSCVAVVLNHIEENRCSRQNTTRWSVKPAAYFLYTCGACWYYLFQMLINYGIFFFVLIQFKLHPIKIFNSSIITDDRRGLRGGPWSLVHWIEGSNPA
jgi:hypothetical protein